MKRSIMLVIAVFAAVVAFSQSNLVSLSGGYSWAKVDDSENIQDDPDIKGTGWRINGAYDYVNYKGNFSYGCAAGYISVSADYKGVADTAEYTVSTVPFYFVPKYLFGKEKIQGFIKLAIGGQSARLKRKGQAGEVKANDFGFYGGGGAGLMIFVKENVFINAEYEIAYMTNSFYRNGLMNSALFGIGLKL